MGDKAECDCCCTPFNKTTHKEVILGCCDFRQCRACINRNVMDTVGSVKCYNCNTGITDDKLEENFTKKWVNVDKRDRDARILISSEKAKLDATQDFVIVKRNIATCDINIQNQDKIIADLEAQLAIARNQRVTFYRTRRRLVNNYYTPNDVAPEQSNEQKREFIFPCAQANCHGFLSTKYKCKLCDTQVCSKCHKIVTEDHVCNNDDVITVDEIKKSTKPCPKCGTRIHKIEGCSQMFCVMPTCGTVFDWNTLEIQEGGVIHNPHVAEYNRQHGTAIGIHNNERLGLCDVNHHDLRVIFSRGYINGSREYMYDDMYTYLTNIVNLKNHITFTEIIRLRNVTQGHTDDEYTIKLRCYRVDFLDNTITEDEWLNLLKKHQKSAKKSSDYLQIFQTAEQIFNDLLREDLHNVENRTPPTAWTAIDLFNMKKRYVQALEFINTHLINLNSKYKVVGRVLNTHHCNQLLHG